MDGAPGGWLAAEWGHTPKFFATIQEALAAYPRAKIAIDIPIGLDEGDRECDKAARALLGPRKSSVFPPPARKDLAAKKRPATLSAQAWNIVPKIREVDNVMTSALQKRVYESHPELVFVALSGAPMKHAKKTPAGVRERLKALDMNKPDLPKGIRMDDALDAFALAQQARRIAMGVAMRLPARPKKDARGLRMEIWG